jgi:hypothetical protein
MVKCRNCGHEEEHHQASNDGEVTDFWCEGSDECTCEHFVHPELPPEMPFTHEDFERLKNMPGKAPDFLVPEDDDL